MIIIIMSQGLSICLAFLLAQRVRLVIPSSKFTIILNKFQTVLNHKKENPLRSHIIPQRFLTP